jgi:hypothetical protein
MNDLQDAVHGADEEARRRRNQELDQMAVFGLRHETVTAGGVVRKRRGL